MRKKFLKNGVIAMMAVWALPSCLVAKITTRV